MLSDCYIKFQDVFDDRTKDTDTWIKERQNTSVACHSNQAVIRQDHTGSCDRDSTTAKCSFSINLYMAGEKELAGSWVLSLS